MARVAGPHTTQVWDKFRERVYNNRDEFMKFVYRVHSQGQRLVGNSYPGRGATLLNFYGITPDLMPYIGELSTSLRLGRYVPGKHIPVMNNRRSVEKRPDYLTLLAWHCTEPVVQRLHADGEIDSGDAVAGVQNPQPMIPFALIRRKDES